MDYKIEKFDKHNDDRGQLVVFLQNRNLPEDQKTFGQIYFVTMTEVGTVRANHYHKKWREWFGIVTGKIEATVIDIQSGKRETIILDENSSEYVRLEIGPNVAHAFKSLTPNASLLNYTDDEWSPDDTFKFDVI